jgi:hypothetical protein
MSRNFVVSRSTFDSGRTAEEDIRRLLDGYAYLAYTSYSHQLALQKWRVFLPYQNRINRISTRGFSDISSNFF